MQSIFSLGAEVRKRAAEAIHRAIHHENTSTLYLLSRRILGPTAINKPFLELDPHVTAARAAAVHFVMRAAKVKLDG